MTGARCPACARLSVSRVRKESSMGKNGRRMRGRKKKKANHGKRPNS